jgi:hypothetical protein
VQRESCEKGPNPWRVALVLLNVLETLMGIVEDRKRQSERELDAYNRMANPQAYIRSGQFAKDQARGKLTKADIQAVADAAARDKGKD